MRKLSEKLIIGVHFQPQNQSHKGRKEGRKDAPFLSLPKDLSFRLNGVILKVVRAEIKSNGAAKSRIGTKLNFPKREQNGRPGVRGVFVDLPQK